ASPYSSSPTLRPPTPTLFPYTTALPISTQGGVALGPARGNAIGATAIQVFTKTPNQWREPVVRDADIAAFRASFAARNAAMSARAEERTSELLSRGNLVGSLVPANKKT